MSDTVIKIENLSKQYKLGTIGSQTLRGDFQRLWWQLKGKGDPFLKIGQENKLDNVNGDYVWALNDINLEVKQGEVLGIIGKNGAGKSTLLKIISRITTPTSGQIKIKGRVASLLEVGTGFHGELTGRENIFLNGAILGMTKAEIKSKFDEIVDFAGIAKYIDTPVKRYSSGMYVRLGFAVAAHLDPEILIVDEVLAVGDAEFQKKAIGKMQDISKGGGRTVLFVSHNMASVEQLCSKSVLLENGHVKFEGITSTVIDYYLHSKEQNQMVVAEVLDLDMNISKIHLSNGDNITNNFTISQNVYVIIDYVSKVYHKDSTITVFVYNSKELLILASHYLMPDSTKGILKVIIPKQFLVPGRYFIKVKIHVPNKYFIDNNENELYFDIEDTGNEHSIYKINLGLVLANLTWVNEKNN